MYLFLGHETYFAVFAIESHLRNLMLVMALFHYLKQTVTISVPTVADPCLIVF